MLHSLVRSLTKSEKRYFRLLAGWQVGDKGFMRLFDCLLKHEFMSDPLTIALADAFPGATLEPARKHLYRVLMQSLRQFEGSSRIDVRLGQLLHDSQILYERGLVQPSQERLEKARRLAEQHERSLYAVLATRQQTEQWVRWQFDGISEPVLAEQHALIRHQLEQTQTDLQHAALYETLLLRYRTLGPANGPQETRRLNDLLLEEYQLLSRQKQKSFAMQQQHLHFQSAYFRMIGDGTGSLRIYRELDNLFQHHPNLWAEQPLYYVQLLDGILTDLRSLERYDEMTYFLNRLQTLAIPDNTLRQFVHYQALYHALSRDADRGNFTEAETQLVAEQLPNGRTDLEQTLQTLALPLRVSLYLVITRIEIGTGRLSDALGRLNRILALPVRSLPGGLYRQSRLMSLLLHTRLNNADYVGYDLRSVTRKLNQMGSLSQAETLILTLVRHWLNGRLGEAAVRSVDAFTGNPADHQLLRELDLRAWLLAVRTPYEIRHRNG